MSEKAEPQRPPLTRGKKILFGVVLAVIVLGGLDFSARIVLRFTQGYDGEHLMQYVYDPYKNVLPTPNFVDLRGEQHNSQGFRRSTDVAVTKPPNTYRVFLMGGSTAAGTGGLWPHIQTDFAVLQNSETIDAYLEEMLGEALPGMNVEVINAAIPSTWTHHHLIYLNQTIVKFDPDMILFLDGFNDFFFVDDGHDQFASYAYLDHASIIMGPPTIKSLAYVNGWWWFRKSALVHALGRSARTVKRFFTPRPEQHPLNVENNLAGLRRVFPNNALAMIERISLIAQHEGVIPVFMLQPLLILERDRDMPDIERELFQFNIDSYLPNSEEFMHRAVKVVASMAQDSVGAVGGHFIDLTEIYEGTEGQIFTDYAHLTPKGNEILAAYVLDQILPWVREDITADSTTSQVTATAEHPTAP